MHAKTLAITLLLCVLPSPVRLSERVDLELQEAVASGDRAQAERLLASGANIDARFDERRTIGFNDNLALVHMLAGVNEPEWIRWLHERDANLDILNGQGKTALMIAAKRGHVESVRLLLELGADPTIEIAGEKDTALTIARRFEHREIVRLLETALASRGGG